MAGSELYARIASHEMGEEFMSFVDRVLESRAKVIPILIGLMVTMMTLGFIASFWDASQDEKKTAEEPKKKKAEVLQRPSPVTPPKPKPPSGSWLEVSKNLDEFATRREDVLDQIQNAKFDASAAQNPATPEDGTSWNRVRADLSELQAMLGEMQKLGISAPQAEVSSLDYDPKAEATTPPGQTPELSAAADAEWGELSGDVLRLEEERIRTLNLFLHKVSPQIR